MGAWYLTAPSVPHADHEMTALQLPGALQQCSNHLPATGELRQAHRVTQSCCCPEKGPWYAGQGLELLLPQAPARSDPVAPLPHHLGEKSPGQVPGATYTAQCNGVKGFPSRYANGLCSSNNSRQSSCPVRREGHKRISAQPAMEREGTEGLSSSPHDQREAPDSWGETAQAR